MNRRKFITGLGALAAYSAMPKTLEAARTFVRASSQGLHSATPLVTTVPFTFAAWVKVTALSDAFQILFSSIDNTGSGFGYFVQLMGTGSGQTPGTVRVRTDASGANGNALSSNQMTTNTWFHICGVFAGTNSRSVYLNNTKVTNTTNVSGPTVAETNIGYFNATFGDYIGGSIAFPAIWAQALTDAQVAALASGVSPRHVYPSALIGFWPLTNGSSPETALNGTQLSLTGSPTTTANPRQYY